MTDDIDFDLSPYRYIAGVDEAGRGPLVGAVVAAAVIPFSLPSASAIIFGFNSPALGIVPSNLP